MVQCVSQTSLAKFSYTENVYFKVNDKRDDEIKDQPEQNWNVTETHQINDCGPVKPYDSVPVITEQKPVASCFSTPPLRNWIIKNTKNVKKEYTN